MRVSTLSRIRESSTLNVHIGALGLANHGCTISYHCPLGGFGAVAQGQQGESIGQTVCQDNVRAGVGVVGG